MFPLVIRTVTGKLSHDIYVVKPGAVIRNWNANGIFWPRDVLQKAISKANIEDGKILLYISRSIDLTNVCGKLINITFDGVDVIAEFKILKTPQGHFLTELIVSNIPVGAIIAIVSARIMYKKGIVI